MTGRVAEETPGAGVNARTTAMLEGALCVALMVG
jgi:hypothetical protein